MVMRVDEPGRNNLALAVNDPHSTSIRQSESLADIFYPIPNDENIMVTEHLDAVALVG